MKLYFRLLGESFWFAFTALRSNKLRTFLSLLGVTIGIFSIIAVLAAIDSLENKINSDLSSLDKNTIYLFKQSFGPSDVPLWKREQFPEMKYDEYVYLKNNVGNTMAMAYQFFTKNESLKYESQIVSSVSVMPTSSEVLEIQSLNIEKGRFFNDSESNSGTPVIVMGSQIATSLFENSDPLGKKIRLYGQRFNVIGVLKKQGAGIFGDSEDTNVYIPANFVRKTYGDNSDNFTPALLIRPNKEVDIEAYKGELAQKLRKFRGLKTGEIDNFFINIFSGFTNFIDDIISQMNLVGWIISGFSLLVGGFGIANIMFVSVKERTNLIGIQKSLGAKNKFILFQFLFEAVILSLIGGVIGLFFVWLISTIVSNVADFNFILSYKNVFLGTGISAIIGLASGILPAISASKLDPVEAIRTGM
jgi:putative ABC transport system permease protein